MVNEIRLCASRNTCVFKLSNERENIFIQYKILQYKLRYVRSTYLNTLQGRGYRVQDNLPNPQT